MVFTCGHVSRSSIGAIQTLYPVTPLLPHPFGDSTFGSGPWGLQNEMGFLSGLAPLALSPVRGEEPRPSVSLSPLMPWSLGSPDPGSPFLHPYTAVSHWRVSTGTHAPLLLPPVPWASSPQALPRILPQRHERLLGKCHRDGHRVGALPG